MNNTNNLNDKINKIDELLNNDELFDAYIQEIENTNIEVPPMLEKSIHNTINNSKQKAFIINIIKISKIAACTIFALIIWNVSFTKPIMHKNIQNNTHEKISINIDNTMKNINEFLLTPINFERNDK